MKRIIALILLGLVVITLTACQAVKKKINPYAEATKEMAATIIEGINANDTEALKGLFCESVKNAHDLDEEIADAFEFVKGDIVSYSDRFYGNSGEEVRDGKVVLKDGYKNIEKIMTDSDNEYRICFEYFLINEEHEDLLGVTVITIRDMKSNETTKIGGRDEFKRK